MIPSTTGVASALDNPFALVPANYRLSPPLDRSVPALTYPQGVRPFSEFLFPDGLLAPLPSFSSDSLLV